jgi:hypothetical protein
MSRILVGGTGNSLGRCRCLGLVRVWLFPMYLGRRLTVDPAEATEHAAERCCCHRPGFESSVGVLTWVPWTDWGSFVFWEDRLVGGLLE